MLLATLIDEKYIQLGFAGFCLILIGVVIWLIKTHNKINQDNHEALVDVIQNNNSALNSIRESEDQVKYSVDALSKDTRQAQKELAEKVDKLQLTLNLRPCMQKKEC